ncbi:flagellar biosynthesis protein FlgA [Micromonospora sp. NPDC049559]|uniref:flagellar biosynthesis protein FlgA n=1 Tax=Micromonospora sp. NPDC049559 TaxID=3155923 RepID=UPI00343C3BE9
MAWGSGRGRGERALRPVRWQVRPRGGTLLRIGLTAGLLALAVGVLYGGPARSTCAPGPAATGGAAAEPGTTAGDPVRGGPGTRDAGTHGGGTPAPTPPAGLVGVPVRIAEPATLAVIRPGGRVDLLVVPTTTGSARPVEPILVAPRALVLTVIGITAGDGTASGLYLALTPEQAQRAIALPDDARLAVIVRP